MKLSAILELDSRLDKSIDDEYNPSQSISKKDNQQTAGEPSENVDTDESESENEDMESEEGDELKYQELLDRVETQRTMLRRELDKVISNRDESDDLIKSIYDSLTD